MSSSTVQPEAPQEPLSEDAANVHSEVKRPSWRPLILQLAGIAAVFAAVVIWLLTANLSETELITLAPDALFGYAIDHLALTAVSAVITLLIAIPLGILLTRAPLKKFTGPVLAVANIGQAAPAIGLVVLLAIAVGFGLPFLLGAAYGLRAGADDGWARSLFFASMPHLVVLFVGLAL